LILLTLDGYRSVLMVACEDVSRQSNVVGDAESHSWHVIETTSSVHRDRRDYSCIHSVMAPTSRIILCRHAQAEHNVDLDYSSKSLHPHKCIKRFTDLTSLSSRRTINFIGEEAGCITCASNHQPTARSRARCDFAIATNTADHQARMGSGSRASRHQERHLLATSTGVQ